MSGLIHYKESLNNIDDLFELPKKDESALKFLSNKRSLEISKELKSAHKSTKISDSSIKSKSSTSFLMKSILISSQKAHEIINSEERESTQNIHSLTPVTNKTLFNSEEEKRCNFPQNKTNKIIQGNDHNVKKLIKYNPSNVFNSISYKQTSLYDYFKK